MARRWRSDVDSMYVTMRRGRRARLEGSCFPEGGARARPLRWARPAPRSALGSPLLTWCFSGLLGAPARLRGSCVGPGLPRRPPLGARFIVVRPFSHISAAVLSRPPSPYGVTPAPSGPSCSSRLRRVALVGLLRGPLPPRRGARSFVALPSVGTSVSLRGFFSASAVFSGQGVRGFPLGAVARGLPPCPPARVPATCRPYLSGPGGRDLPGPCSGPPAPAPLAGGVPAAPLHPLRPRRGERCFS